MAPEVRYAGKKHVKRYSGGADWYTLGVLLYELTEQRLPFGEDPRFHDMKAEWRKPKAFVTEEGKKDVHAEGMLVAEGRGGSSSLFRTSTPG